MNWNADLERQWAEAERRRDLQDPGDLIDQAMFERELDEDAAYDAFWQRCLDGECDHDGCCRSGTG